MKNLLIAAMFLMISAASFGQVSRITTAQQTWLNQPQYSTGGYSKLVLNSTTGRVEYTPNTLLSGSVVAVVENDSARNYNFTGSSICRIKYATRDTVNLANSSYMTNQIFTFVVTASGADTTVFIPASGTVDGGTSLTLTGTRNSVSMFYDGTNYWIRK